MPDRHPGTYVYVSECSTEQNVGEVGYLLYESVATAATGIVLLELDEFELAKRLEDILKILLSDAEVDIANVQTVEGDRVGVASGGASLADLTVLLSFGKLDDDRDT